MREKNCGCAPVLRNEAGLVMHSRGGPVASAGAPVIGLCSAEYIFEVDMSRCSTVQWTDTYVSS